MNRNDFLNMMENRVCLDRPLLGEVYELIDIFPYFQSAHLLLLKGLQNNADVKFENQLRISAVHIADREILYYHLKEKSAPVFHSEVVEQPETVPVSPGSFPQQTVIESAKNSDLLINEIEKDDGNDDLKEQQDDGADAAGHSILISVESDIEDSSGVMLVMDEEASSNDENIFYMDPGFSVSDQSDLLELDIEGEQNASSVESLKESSGIVKEANSRQQIQSQLIDNFIIANPRIEPVREKSNLPFDDILKPDIEDERGLVTETLARIYINQEYYSKAIDIYERLSLKFPEKSSYFASQIEKVKEYIKK